MKGSPTRVSPQRTLGLSAQQQQAKRTSPPARDDAAPPLPPSERTSLEALLRYETMVRTQDADIQATCGHLRPLFDAVQELGREQLQRDKAGRNKGGTGGGFFGFGRTFSSSPAKISSPKIDDDEQLAYECIECAYRILNNPTISETSNGAHEGNGDASAAAQDISMRRNSKDELLELIKSDRQLMYVLGMLASARGRSSDAKSTEGNAATAAISFAEFVQCYRAAVGGMQCIQHMSSSGRAANDTLVVRGRKRVVDRTALMVRSFGPDGVSFIKDADEKEQQQQTKSPRSSSSGRRQSIGGGIFESKLFGGDDDDDQTGELEEEIDYLRRLLAVKDKQLVRVLTDHAKNVESISYETDKKAEEIGLYIRKRRRKRRRLRRILVVLLLLFLAFCYKIGVIRVFVQSSKSLPRVSFHLNEIAGYVWAEKDALELLKQDNLRKKYRILALEAQEKALEAELKGVKVRHEVTAQELKRSEEEVRSSGSKCAVASSVGLDSCRSEMRKLREEAATLRLERKENCAKKQDGKVVQGLGAFARLLLGPFNGLLD